MRCQNLCRWSGRGSAARCSVVRPVERCGFHAKSCHSRRRNRSRHRSSTVRSLRRVSGHGPRRCEAPCPSMLTSIRAFRTRQVPILPEALRMGRVIAVEDFEGGCIEIRLCSLLPAGRGSRRRTRNPRKVKRKDISPVDWVPGLYLIRVSILYACSVQ